MQGDLLNSQNIDIDGKVNTEARKMAGL